jgi:[acyl-carrier-protein] S-malonyltransferase
MQPTAILFPGQGSQHVGMATAIIAAFPEAAAVFKQANDILGYDLAALCADGPAEKLDQTEFTQPALYVTGFAAWRALQAYLIADGHHRQEITAFAGHSLGEFTALAAAGIVEFEDGLRLVAERGRLMAEAGRLQPGAMAALLGGDVNDAHAICQAASAETGLPVVVGNDNCPGQIVISGDSIALARALEIAKLRGIKRAIPLAVSVAAHSPLMASASTAFGAALAKTPFRNSIETVIGNTTAAPLTDEDEVRAELAVQLVSTLRWTESMQYLKHPLKTARFLELGAKEVLTGMLRRIHRDLPCLPINTPEHIYNFSEIASD